MKFSRATHIQARAELQSFKAHEQVQYLGRNTYGLLILKAWGQVSYPGSPSKLILFVYSSRWHPFNKLGTQTKVHVKCRMSPTLCASSRKHGGAQEFRCLVLAPQEERPDGKTFFIRWKGEGENTLCPFKKNSKQNPGKFFERYESLKD